MHAVDDPAGLCNNDLVVIGGVFCRILGSCLACGVRFGGILRCGCHRFRGINVHVRQHFLHDTAENLLGIGTVGLLRHVRLVHHHIKNDLGIVNGRCAQEGNHVVLLVSGDFLRRPGLAADLVAFHPCRTTCTGHNAVSGNNMIKVCPQRLCCLLGNGALHHLGLYRLHGSAAAVQNLLHHMGLIVGAAIDNGRKGGNHLDHGGVKALSEGVCCQVGNGHGIRIQHQTSCLARQVNAGAVSDVKDRHIFSKIVHTNAHTHGHKSRVAGLHQCLIRGQIAVAVPVGAADIVFSYVEDTHAGKAVAVPHLAGLQSGGDGHGLHGGTRLKTIRNTVISPDAVISLAQRLVVHGRDLFICIKAGHRQIPGIVQVKVGILRHSQHRAGVGIHDDGRADLTSQSLSGLVGMLLIKLPQLIFHNGLDVGVNGGNDRFAVLGRFHRPFQLGIFIQITVFPAIYSI